MISRRFLVKDTLWVKIRDSTKRCLIPMWVTANPQSFMGICSFLARSNSALGWWKFLASRNYLKLVQTVAVTLSDTNSSAIQIYPTLQFENWNKLTFEINSVKTLMHQCDSRRRDLYLALVVSSRPDITLTGCVNTSKNTEKIQDIRTTFCFFQQ